MIARVYGRWMPSADYAAGNKAINLWAGGGENEGRETIVKN